jgi:quercetin dioxygenase-like cupin family protein
VVGARGGDAWWVAGSLMMAKATGDDTARGLTLIEQSCAPGLYSPAHVHDDEEQLLWLLEGSIEVTCGGVTRTADAGSLVVMPHGLPHEFTVTSEHGARFLSITTPAGFERLVREIGERAPTLEPPPSGAALDPDAVAKAAPLGYRTIE